MASRTLNMVLYVNNAHFSLDTSARQFCELKESIQKEI